MSRTTVIVACIVAASLGFAGYLVANRDAATTHDAAASLGDVPPSELVRTANTGAEQSALVSITSSNPEQGAVTDTETENEYERMKDEITWALGGHYLDQECTREPHYRVDADTGATIEMVKSNCTSTRPEHPYRAYTTETLESLAYSDPIAAVVLGQRMWANNDNIHKTVDMMMRATALSNGQWGHLNWLTNQRFSGLSRNGVPDVQSIHARYVLETVMDQFRENGPQRDSWYERARETYVIPDEEIARLEHTADLYLARIRQIQRDVLGLTDMEVDEHEQQTPKNP